MKIAIVSDLKNQVVKIQLIKTLEKLDFKIVDLNESPSNDIIVACDHLKQALKKHQIDRGFVIDDYGIAPFMYLAKQADFVVAEIADEHSALMTAEHNGSNIVTFGTKISTIDQMINMAVLYLNHHYLGGRHQSRLDMMNDLLKKEV